MDGAEDEKVSIKVIDELVYEVADLLPGTPVFFQIACANVVGQTEFSPVVQANSAASPPLAPSGLQARPALQELAHRRTHSRSDPEAVLSYSAGL